MQDYIKKNNLSSVLMMITVFFIVVILMVFTSKIGPPKLHDPISKLTEDIGVYKGRYFNKLFNFTLSAPDSNNWKFSYPTNIDSTFIDGTNKINSKEVVRLEHFINNDTLAIVKVELFKLDELTKVEILASDDMAYIIDTQQKKGEAISIVSDVVVVSSVDLTAAFYVLEFPEKTYFKYPVWVTMHIIRDNTVYKIICISKRENYEDLKSKFEKILQDISFI